MKNITAILFFALGIFTSAQAQIKLNNLSAGISYWERSYEGPNEKAFFLGFEADDSFTKGGVMPHIGAEVNLYRGLAVDARVGFWSGNFENSSQFGDLVIDESIDQTVIPVSAGLVYNFNGFSALNFYTGVGVNRYFIQNKVKRDISGGEGVGAEKTFSGNNYGAYVKAGGEYMLTPSLGLALEGRYNAGYYNQNFEPNVGEDMVKEKVSLRGLEVGLSLRYRFSPAHEKEATAPETEDEE